MLTKWLFKVTACAEPAKKTGERPPITAPLLADKLDADLVGRRLFLSVKENNSIAVIDMDRRTFITSLSGVAAPQGMKVVPSLGLVLCAGDNDGALHAFSLTPPFAQLWSVNVGGSGGADNVDYDAATGLAWVAYGDNSGAPYGALAYVSITASGGTVLGSIPFPANGHPEEFHISPTSNYIYASCPQANSTMVVVNRVTKTIVSQWPLLPTASDNFANELDTLHDRIFVSAYGTTPGTPAYGHPQFVVLNLFDGSFVWTMPTTAVCDNIKLDAATGRIYIACGGSAVPNDPSVLFIVQQYSANSYALVGKAPEPAPYLLARTMYFDSATSAVYLAVPFNNAVSPVQQAAVLVFHVLSNGSAAPVVAGCGNTNPPQPTAGTSAAVVALAVVCALLISGVIVLAILFGRRKKFQRRLTAAAGTPRSLSSHAVTSPIKLSAAAPALAGDRLSGTS